MTEHNPEDNGTGPLLSHENPSKKLFIEVLGCQMNKLDGEIALENCRVAGYDMTDDPDQAQAAIFFTCAVRQRAENRFFSRLGRWQQRKARQPGLMIAVAGCIAQEHGESLLADFPFVDVVCGTRRFADLPQLMAQAAEDGPIVATGDRAIAYTRRQNLAPNPGKAFISIMRGCNMHCTYCIVPSVRGREISRPADTILAEAQALAEQGVREITFLGQTVNAYGRDLTPRTSLAELIRRAGAIPDLARLHIVTSHPRFMTEDLMTAIAEVPAACEGIHLPAQSGANPVLKRMARGYTREDYLKVIAECRSRIPGFQVAGDFIVGFPGETDADFALTEDLVRQVRFQNLFIFQYSERPGTRAAGWPDDVPQEVKAKRNHRLLALQEEIAHASNQNRIGQTLEVLVDGPSKRNPERFSGRSRTGQIVIFPPTPATSETGRLIHVTIDRATHLALYGNPAEAGTDGGRPSS